jgi:acyl-CoA thioesterase YciA
VAEEAGGTPREPAVRTVAMPADANPTGDIFGGWVLAQMDVAGGVVAARRARGRVVTVALDGLSFHEPIKVGDVVSCYAEVVEVGTTSLKVKVHTEVIRRITGEPRTVTDGLFTYVALGPEGRPRPVDEP